MSRRGLSGGLTMGGSRITNQLDQIEDLVSLGMKRRQV